MADPSSANSTTAQPPPPVATDSMSSLRAAALLSLKSKRRARPPADEPAPVQAPSNGNFSRPPTTDDGAMQLDYGSEETPAQPAPSVPAGGPSPQAPAPSTPLNAEDGQIRDGQIREEGEISDGDQTPTNGFTPLPSTTSTVPLASSGSLLDRIEGSSQNVTTLTLANPVLNDTNHVNGNGPTSGGASAFVGSPRVNKPSHGFDPDYARPGVQRTWLPHPLSYPLTNPPA